MNIKLATAMTTLAFAAAAAAQSTSGTPGTPGTQSTTSAPGTAGSADVMSVKPVHTESMEKLQLAAQRLRESIQAMAQKQPGAEREYAIGQAHEALLQTQQAMLALPPELRSTGTVSNENYDESVKKLMKAADSLRESIQAMARQPAGEGRNRAMEQANQALWDTQMAMVSAYVPRNVSSSMGAGSATGAGMGAGAGSATGTGAGTGTGSGTGAGAGTQPSK